MGRKNKVDKVLNVRGLLCPRPTLMVTYTLDKMNVGEILEVVSNDKCTLQSIPELCDTYRYTLLDSYEEKGLIYYVVQK